MEEVNLLSPTGVMYVTTYSTLNKYPNTLLGNKDRRKQFYSQALKAFYFNRSRVCFESILQYYQTGEKTSMSWLDDSR